MITSLQHKNSFVLVVAIFSILFGATVSMGQTAGFTYQISNSNFTLGGEMFSRIVLSR